MLLYLDVLRWKRRTRRDLAMQRGRTAVQPDPSVRGFFLVTFGGGGPANLVSLASNVDLVQLSDRLTFHHRRISSAVSIALVTTYLRIVTGTQFALREAAAAQFIYLVAFSYAFFLRGFTGLAITIGSILTLFVVMQATGKIRWKEKFSTAETGASANLA